MQYIPTWQSLKQHTVPNWFHDAKLGVLIHWGPATIPAWAPIDGNLHQLINHKGFEYYFTNNPYVEWYYNTTRIKGSPSEQYHQRNYGAEFSYFDFAPRFNKAITTWNPGDWVNLFHQVGVKYVVLVTKHHDGFLLWPSQHRNPFHDSYQTTRDATGELTAAVRQLGMKMGLYYSGGLDWTFNDSIIRCIPSLYDCVPQSREYVAYTDAHWRELIDRYQPSIMWGDIAYPAKANLPELFAYYYNRVPDGLINDRFAQELPDAMDTTESVISPTNEHYDFVTPEYSSFNHAREAKWETNRGIGYSFAYNLNETLETHLSFAELVHLLVDVVSKNGNLLLGVGPMADGNIPPIQQKRLEELGGWLEINGEAIFGTRPWVLSETDTNEGIPVRFTQKGNIVYAVLLSQQPGHKITFESLQMNENTNIRLLGHDADISWHQHPNDLTIILPDMLIPAQAYTLEITPPPIATVIDSG